MKHPSELLDSYLGQTWRSASTCLVSSTCVWFYLYYTGEHAAKLLLDVIIASWVMILIKCNSLTLLVLWQKKVSVTWYCIFFHFVPSWGSCFMLSCHISYSFAQNEYKHIYLLINNEMEINFNLITLWFKNLTHDKIIVITWIWQNRRVDAT